MTLPTTEGTAPGAGQSRNTRRPSVTVGRGTFLRDGVPHRIISGAVHYFRVHPDLWRDRLLRLRALGLNTIETYVAWNFHERRRGEVDFTGPRDLSRFVRTAGDLGFDVIVRPGPYICAEWDFGGLPAWLMKGEPMALRTSDPRFLDAVDDWFDAVVPVLLPLLATNGGPVVAVQVENEYGSYGDDAAYLAHLRDGLRHRGVDVLLFTSDGAGPDWLASGMVPSTLATANFGSRPTESFAELRKAQPDGPDMCMEYWNGWFDHWGEPRQVRAADDAAQVLDEMLGAGASVNLYMAHGGTSFGLWSGCNVDPVSGALQPTVTSYDYDAAVGEAGELSPKFHAFREVIGRYAAGPLPEIPSLPARLAPQTTRVRGWVALLDSLGVFDVPRRAPHPMWMEDLDQDHGLVVYRGSVLVPPDGRRLLLDGVADRATVIVDDEVRAVVHRDDEDPSVPMVPRPDGARTRIDVVVENQGRINFGTSVGERKGLSGVRLAHRFVHGWDSIAVRLDDETLTSRLRFGTSADAGGPVFARGTLEVDAAADGFLALPGWGKGFVWLNGALLGRYWEIGPQRTLYAPAPLWRPGENEVVVLEMDRPGSVVELRSAPDLG